MDMLRTAVIGVGTFGITHVEAYAWHHRCKLVAVCDKNEARCRQIASRYGCNAYTDYSEMFSKERLDAVSIATPDFAHRDPAVQAAEAGLHILLEKPMATSVGEAEEIADAARRAGVILMIDFHNRWSPPFVELKRSIERGEMGDPLYVQARLNDTIYVPTKMLSWAGRSNVLWFLGSHMIDLARWLLSSDPERVYCVKGSGLLASRGIQTEDFFLSTIKFKSGSATVENSWVLPETHPFVCDLQFEFVGTEGSYTVNMTHSSIAEKYTKDKKENPDVVFSLDLHGRPAGFSKQSIWHFAESVLSGKQPLVSPEDGIWVTRTIESLLRSARTGRALPVE